MTQEIRLFTGGAGYIGEHIANVVSRAGKPVVTYDSLYQGLIHRISYLRTKYNMNMPLIEADICNYKEIQGITRKYKIDEIVHTAALKAVGESMQKSVEYFALNLTAKKEFIDIPRRNNVKKVIFSSTATVCDSPDFKDLRQEGVSKAPISSYGYSKFQVEAEVTAFISTNGNQGTSLCVYNIVGMAALELLTNSVENLVPIILGKLNADNAIEIFGTDYPTPNGTHNRDYVDVRDIACVHLAAAYTTQPLPPTLNIGTGRGASMRAIIELVLKVTKKSDSQVIESSPRAGNPSSLCADVTFAKSAMDFESQHSLEASIKILFPEKR